jgi:hypothetical protein
MSPPAIPLTSTDPTISHLLKCKHLPEHKIKALCETVRSILIEESNVQPVSSPVTVCGDIHGQFWDVIELLRSGGMVPETSYVFMGEFRASCWLRGGGEDGADRVVLSEGREGGNQKKPLRARG